MKVHRPIRSSVTRRGTILPALLMALLVAAVFLALVFDQVWLRTARFEVQSAANAAALAAASHLADDHLLRSESDFPARADLVRRLAGNVAARNRAAGKVIRIDRNRPEDVRIGRIVHHPLTGQPQFLETDYEPNHVVITAHCDESHGNPVSLFFPYLTGRPAADVRALAAASISNDVVGVRPLASGSVPAWPLAVLESSDDPAGGDTWSAQIEDRQGSDDFGWDAATGTVVEGSDGIPEMVLRTRTGETPGNVHIVDLGSGFYDEPLQRQFHDGIYRADLHAFGEQLRFDRGPLTVGATSDLSGAAQEWLTSQTGRSRIILLYSAADPEEEGEFGTVTVTRPVAARIMRVGRTAEGLEIVIQPSVIATRTAVLRETPDADPESSPNRYLYKLALTN